jgi:predicted amidohydrolase
MWVDVRGQVVRQAGQEGLLVADLDLTAPTGLLAARCRSA